MVLKSAPHIDPQTMYNRRKVRSVRSLLKLFVPRLLLDILQIMRIRKGLSKTSGLLSAAPILRTITKPAITILFYPKRPGAAYISAKLCALLGYAGTENRNRRFDVAFKRQDRVNIDPSIVDPEYLGKADIINSRRCNTNKRYIDQVSQKVLGYSVMVDPTRHEGDAVEKSDKNATHDGRIVSCPISATQIDPNSVYQKVIDNRVSSNLVMDYRIPVHGGRIPLVYKKYRPIEIRFLNQNSLVEIDDFDSIFDDQEREKIHTFCYLMGLDYAELDVLRNSDGRICIIDANCTPYGPPKGLADSLAKICMERLASSFESLVQAHVLKVK